MRNKSLESGPMNALAEAQSLVRQVAGERGSSKERIRAAAMRLPRLTFNRVRELFYGIGRCHVWAEELDYLRQAATTPELKKAASDEYEALSVRIARLEAAMLRTDPDMFGAQAHAWRTASRRDDSALD
jgi:hypothetical protein